MKMLTLASLLCASTVAPTYAQQGQPATFYQPEQEIFVIGKRLRSVRFHMKRDRKTMAGSCRITRKSGDLMLDAMVCEAAVACMGNRKISGPDFNSCMTPRWQALTNKRAAQLRAKSAAR
jgi:hypothetical protein